MLYGIQLSAVKRLGTGVLAVGALLIGSSLATPAQAQTVCSPSHIVQPGENLFRIALAAGTDWPSLMQLNGIPNSNLIYVGEVICLPGSTVVNPTVMPPMVTPMPTSTSVYVSPSTGVTLPPPNVFPSIDFNTHSAAPGDTITITGVNFPTNSTADVFITPLLSMNAYADVAQTTTSATGTLSFAFTIPTTVNGQPLQGNAFSVLIKTTATGYYGFNFFYNSRGY